VKATSVFRQPLTPRHKTLFNVYTQTHEGWVFCTSIIFQSPRNLFHYIPIRHLCTKFLQTYKQTDSWAPRFFLKRWEWVCNSEAFMWIHFCQIRNGWYSNTFWAFYIFPVLSWLWKLRIQEASTWKRVALARELFNEYLRRQPVIWMEKCKVHSWRNWKWS
jgi:hypothetical protein